MIRIYTPRRDAWALMTCCMPLSLTSVSRGLHVPARVLYRSGNCHEQRLPHRTYGKRVRCCDRLVGRSIFTCNRISLFWTATRIALKVAPIASYDEAACDEMLDLCLTVQRPEVTSCNLTAPIATFDALRKRCKISWFSNGRSCCCGCLAAEQDREKGGSVFRFA